jgi:putative transposase
MMKVYKSLGRVSWRNHIWARGHFVASSGNVTDKVITKYIEEQVNVPHYGVFKVND